MWMSVDGCAVGECSDVCDLVIGEGGVCTLLGCEFGYPG